jgi:PAS domain S-box-containing protein
MMTERPRGPRAGEHQDFGASSDAKPPQFDEFFTAHLLAIVNSAEEIVVSKTLDGIVRSWNRGAERVFGFVAEEMIGQPITRIIPPELHAEEDRLLDALRAGVRIERYETTRLTRDGERVDVSIGLSPIRDGQDAIVGAVKVGHEISARRRAEAALREEARALETLNRVGQTVAAQLDLTRVVQTVTDAATELSDAAFGAFFYNVVSENNESYFLYTLSGAPREAFSRFPNPRNTALFGATFSGEGVVRSDDITQDPRYGRNAPYHGMPEGHLPVHSYLAVPVISRSGEVLGGLFLGHPSVGVFTERAERLVVGIAAQAATALDNARLYEGVQRELAARVEAEKALRESESQLRQVLVEREELLESERAARSEAERLSRMKDEFLTTLSHELRTPLHAIQGWAKVLSSDDVTAADRARGIETIERNVRAQARLVNDLLDMSRITSGKMQLEVQPVQLQEVIEAAIESVLPSADAKGIRLRSLLDTEIGPIRGDPARLQQVLWNLLSNAVKFTPRGGRIQVILERVNSHAEILIEDTGIGIHPDFLPHVFDRFRQGDPSASRRHGGLGLGLSIVKSLIELHGGSVRVKSPGDGQGCTFVISLPVSIVRAEGARRDPRRRADPIDTIELPRLDGVRVLLIDDEPDGLALAVHILERGGANTRTTSRAAEALELLRTDDFDVLVSDIGMPDLDGYELIRRAREIERARSIPAIALTAYARAEDRQRSLLAGYQMHIAKPIDGPELIAGIASLLRIARTLR